VYADEWTNPLVATPGAPFTYSYSGLATTAPVSNTNCIANWTADCRIVINYPQHIHPLWSAPRMANAVDVSCAQAGCHAPTNANAMAAVPAAQLDLTDGPSPDEADHLNAYRELLFGDNRQIVMNGALVDELVPSGQVDAAGNPILVPVAVPQSMSSVGANASGRFFSRFDAGGTHAGYLTLDELKLISEWLDIGAQYFNNPFDPNVPVN
jgi:hypothetical protein